jgi:hypothetical protein
MTTTCLIDNQLDERFYLLTTPDFTAPNATPWGSDAYALKNTCVGKLDTVPIVALNRDIEIKDGLVYYMKTKVLDINLNPLCFFKERIEGTLTSSRIWYGLESGDGKEKTLWIDSKQTAPFQFSLRGHTYRITPKWISQGLGFDNLQYTVTLLS